MVFHIKSTAHYGISLCTFSETLVLFWGSLLSSFDYKVKFSAGNRCSGESSTGQTKRRKRAKRTGWRKHRGKGTNKRLQSGEQGCAVSAKHVSYDNHVKYRNDKFWKLKFTSHHELLSSRSAGLSYLLAEWLIQTHDTRLDNKQCDKQLFLLLTHVDRKCKLTGTPSLTKFCPSFQFKVRVCGIRC